MERIFHFDIKTQKPNETILSFLQDLGFSRSCVILLKNTPDGVLKNGAPCFVNTPLLAGDHLEIRLRETTGSPKIPPVDLPIEILYEDEDIMVLNKPAKMPVHPSLNHYENTLANGVMHYFHAQGIPYTFRCITRLDRDTTGLVLLAKNMFAAGILSEDMKHHKIEKSYVAICDGITPEEGTINAPIARAGESVVEREVNFETGDEAITCYERLDERNGLSLVRVYPKTGRTHQIRVHMKHIGHPLIGDFLYHPDCTLMNRQALHADELRFVHPFSRESMCFKAPLPADMSAFFQ